MAVAIDDVWDLKLSAMDAHVSQVYEWLPWVDGRLDEVPADPAAPKSWLSSTFSRSLGESLSPVVKAALEKRYGAEARQVRRVECFELCEYGRRSAAAELQGMFPKIGGRFACPRQPRREEARGALPLFPE